MIRFSLLFLLATLPFHAQENVLLLIADDLGVDNVAVYAENPNAANTPTIDGLAEAGVLFRNAWSNPVCSPTRAGIFTGRFGFRTGVGDVVTNRSTGVLALDEWTLPEALATGGYQSALIGKWHVGNELNGGAQGPNDAGWDYYAGLLSGALDDYYDWPRTVQGVTQNIQTYATTAQVDDAIEWIGSQTQPWFCIVAFTGPHSPFHEPPANLHGVDLSGLDVNSDPTPFYKAAVEAMDSEIGRLLDSLGEARESTHIVFIGDNGTPGQVVETPLSLGKAKGTVYEGGVNVPMIVSGPAVVQPGREVVALASTVDLYGTIIELCGLSLEEAVPAETQLDTVSLVPVLSGSRALGSRLIYTEFFNDDTDLSAARNRRFKLIRDIDAEALYDLWEDPQEEANLLDATLTEQQAGAYDRLVMYMDDLQP